MCGITIDECRMIRRRRK